MANYLTIDVGGTYIKYALMDAEATIIEQGEVPTPKMKLDPETHHYIMDKDVMDGLWHDFVEAVGGIYDKYADQIEGIAMSAPGRIDAQKGYFYTSGALIYIGERDMAKVMAERCPKPFTVENDAKSAALAELWKGSMKGIDNGIVMTLGTGIGGAVIINGQLYRGTTFAAGEFSCIPTQWTQMPVSSTLWSSYASTSSLVRKYAEKKGVSTEGVSGRTFFEAANNGEQDALEVLDDFCLGIATGLFGLQLALDVQKVAIGGGISKQPILIKTINKQIKSVWDANKGNPATPPEVVSCEFGNDANLIGALYHYLNEVKK